MADVMHFNKKEVAHMLSDYGALISDISYRVKNEDVFCEV